MESKPGYSAFVALLRGINVSGRHKVPMARLRKELEKIGCSDVHTLLNSGNVIFRAKNSNSGALQAIIASHLRQVFDFEVPTWVIDAPYFKTLSETNPYDHLEFHDHLRYYVTFTGDKVNDEPDIPFELDSGGFRIISRDGPVLYSILDLRKSKTPDAMGLLEKMYGKGITTRNWNTISRILKKLETLGI